MMEPVVAYQECDPLISKAGWHALSYGADRSQSSGRWPGIMQQRLPWPKGIRLKGQYRLPVRRS